MTENCTGPHFHARMLRAWVAPLCWLAVCFVPSGARAEAPSGGRGVLVEICEDQALRNNRWPETRVRATESFREDAFGIFELPQKYISTGVRADRAFPTLVRASAQVTLPRGNHRLLLRGRGAARLSVGGKVVLETPFDQPRQFATGNAGELPMEEQDKRLELGAGGRLAPPGNRETWTALGSDGMPTNVVLETLVGGIEPKSRRPFRPDLGETVVAIRFEGTAEWRLLSPGGQVFPYTDAGWAAYEQERQPRFAAMNAAARAARRAATSAYWDRRREVARSWLASTPEVSVPPLPRGFAESNVIDRFIAARIARATPEAQSARKPGGVDFQRDIEPIIEANCYSCHQGSKVKGSLRLDLRAAALEGGENDGPAIVPGKPAESAVFRRITSSDTEEVMPAKGDPLPAGDVALIRRWIEEGASWPEFSEANLALTPLTDDLTFLRRATLDTVGVVPSEREIADFRSDPAPGRRTRWIERLLADPRWADQSMGYWLDVLAENPNLINPTLNNTGPFRWWLYESLRDNKPLDLFVTELVRLEGSERFGGPAGFGVASQNDVPMAAKAVIISAGFLGVDMKCARCHDAPTHSSRQAELFSLAAMLETKPIKLPATSSVPLDHLKLGGREPLIKVTLPPGSTVNPAWPFAEFCDEQIAAALAESPDNPRDRLAALITAPQNQRFAEVMVNRIWERFMGRGIVEQVGDWEKSTPSHPELLRWLARELVRSGYDQKAIARLILNSHAYQRAADPRLTEPGPLFAAPAPRHPSAEQLVDSMFAATGKAFRVEPVNLDLDGVRTIENALDLGEARRAWMLASVSNERDRPSLMLPRIQAVTEVLEVFGWRGARPDPGPGVRDVQANLLQPALLANGTMMTWLTRLSDDHGVTRIALENQPVETLVERLFLRMFTRPPTTAERERYAAALREGYVDRKSEIKPAPALAASPRRKYVAWSNHMQSEANTLRLEDLAAARRGEPPTARLDPAWRERCEDVLWALLNAPEWTRIL